MKHQVLTAALILQILWKVINSSGVHDDIPKKSPVTDSYLSYCLKKTKYSLFADKTKYCDQNAGLIEIYSFVLENKELKEIDLSLNHLKKLPDEVSNWSNLIKAIFSYNNLKELPEQVKSWTNVKEVDLDNNNLEKLPEGIGCWKKISRIHLEHNNLEKLPEGIGCWEKITVIWLSSNYIKLLPEEVRDWVHLKQFYIEHNNLEKLPESVGNWKEVIFIRLNNNYLVSLPEGVRYWVQLKYIYIENNSIEELPEGIGFWRRVRRADLSNNKLRSLPHSIIYFKKNFPFDSLKLTGNKLDELGEGDTLGWRELKAVFGTKVKLDESDASMTAGSKEDVYDRLNSEPIHWNLDVLRTLKLDAVNAHILLGDKILNIWKNALHQYAPQDSRIEVYIKTLYGIDKHAFEGWRMYPESVDSTKDIIEAVFRKLEEIVEKDIESVKLHLSVLEQALDECPDRQIIALNSLYSRLRYNKDMQKSFESFTKHEIACIKSYIFEMTVMLSSGIENPNLDEYLNDLNDEIGIINTEHVTQKEFKRGPFEGNVLNVLNSFYIKLTPRYMIKSLVCSINSDPERLRQASDFFSRRVGDDPEMWDRAFEFGSDEDRNARKPKLITKEGVEKILVEMGILKRYRSMLGY